MNPAACRETWRGHQGAIYDAVWHEGSQSWLTAGGDGVVPAWKTGLADGRALFHHEQAFFSVAAFGSDVLAGNASGEIMHLHEGQARRIEAHSGPVYTLSVGSSTDFWSGDGNGVVKRWILGKQGVVQAQTWSTDLGKIRHIEPSPKGALVATGSGQVAIISPEGSLQIEAKAHEKSCYWAIWHPYKQGVVISGGQQGQLAAHKDGESLLRVQAHQSAIYRATIVDDKLLTCSRDKSVKAWSLDTLGCVGRIDLAHTRSINAMAFDSSNAAQFVTGGDDRSLKLWNLAALTTQ